MKEGKQSPSWNASLFCVKGRVLLLPRRLGLQVAAATVKAGPDRVQPVAGLIVVRAVYIQGRLVKLQSLNAALYL